VDFAFGRVAFLVLPEHPATPGFLRTAERVAAPLGVNVIPVGITTFPKLNAGFPALRASRMARW
jgi:hypothetical protein